MGNQPKRKKTIAFIIYRILICLIALLLISKYFFQSTSLYFLDDINLPFSLHLNNQQLYMIPGEEYKLFVYGINKRVTYTSTNFRVAGVNFNGRVRAHRVGKTYILAETDNTILKCRVYVININKKKLQLKKGDACRLRINGNHSFVSWKSSNPKIVSVSMFGRVKANKKGKAFITAKVNGKTFICRVTVK